MIECPCHLNKAVVYARKVNPNKSNVTSNIAAPYHNSGTKLKCMKWCGSLVNVTVRVYSKYMQSYAWSSAIMEPHALLQSNPPVLVADHAPTISRIRGGTTAPAAPARAVPLFRLVWHRRTSFSRNLLHKIQKNIILSKLAKNVTSWIRWSKFQKFCGRECPHRGARLRFLPDHY